MKLKLIETYLPLEALARAAANETRAGVGAPSSLHLWWGNRQVAIAKGLVFAQLVDAPEFGDGERTHEVHGVLAGLLNGDPLVEPMARELIRESCGGEWPTVYDPFCGVGTVPFAALALGVPAIGGELNPVVKMSDVLENVISLFAAKPGVKVSVKLDIEASAAVAFDKNTVIRPVSENSKNLGFTSFEFTAE